MRRIRFIGLIAAAALALAATAAWAGGAKESSSQPVTLSISASQGWIDQVDKTLGDKFTEQTGIKIDWQIVPANQYITLLHTKLNAGEESDIFLDQVSPVTLKNEIDPQKNAIDLSGQPWVSRVDPLWLPAVSVDGKVYGFPLWNAGTYFVYTYNKKIFAQLNLPVPHSYQQFKDDAAKIKAAGIVPVYEAVSDGWHHVLPIMEIGATYEKQNPGLINKLNNNQIKLAQVPSFITAITELGDFAKLGYFGPDYLSNTTADSYQAMASGKAAMYLGNMGYAEDLIKRFPNVGPLENWGIFVEPWDNSQLFDQSVGGPMRFGYVKSPHSKQILQYFDFMAQQANLEYWLANNTTYPLSVPFTGVAPHVDSIEAAALKEWPDKGVVFQHSVKYLDPQWFQMGKDLEAMFVGTMTPEQVAASIDKRRAEQAALQHDPAWPAQN